MATSATALDKNLWGGGVAPLKATYGKLMMWFFLLSDAFTFSALLITYGLIRYSHAAFDPSPCWCRVCGHEKVSGYP